MIAEDQYIAAQLARANMIRMEDRFIDFDHADLGEEMYDELRGMLEMRRALTSLLDEVIQRTAPPPVPPQYHWSVNLFCCCLVPNLAQIDVQQQSALHTREMRRFMNDRRAMLAYMNRFNGRASACANNVALPPWVRQRLFTIRFVNNLTFIAAIDAITSYVEPLDLTPPSFS